jgi:NAD(P)-dependent dehydrogenase (short-subunit alcohol dehydrogenase family)
MGRLDGKIALITGGARGLGAEGAKAMAREGAKVMIGDLLDDLGKRTVAEINDAGGKAAYTHHDATDEKGWQEIVKKTVEQFGGLNILVNNAGIEIVKTIEDTTLADLQRISAINEHGVFMGVKYAIEPMKAAGGGSIINLSSVAGMQGFVGLAAYCMTKGGVRLLTKAAAVELARTKTGIRVNSIHPGLIGTAMAQRLFEGYTLNGFVESEDSAVARFVERHPIGRLGIPADIANAIVFLASDESAFITGTEIVVDGGLCAD